MRKQRTVSFLMNWELERTRRESGSEKFGGGREEESGGGRRGVRKGGKHFFLCDLHAG